MVFITSVPSDVDESSKSVDDELARSASQSLNIAPSKDVVRIDDSNFQTPKTLHAGLYSSSLSDSLMESAENSSQELVDRGVSAGGVPGFPDFPDCWGGETGSERRQQRVPRSSASKAQSIKCKRNARKQRRLLVRKAVNFIPSSRQRKAELKEHKRKLRMRILISRKQKVQRKQNMSELNQQLSRIKM